MVKEILILLVAFFITFSLFSSSTIAFASHKKYCLKELESFTLIVLKTITSSFQQLQMQKGIRLLK